MRGRAESRWRRTCSVRGCRVRRPVLAAAGMPRITTLMTCCSAPSCCRTSHGSIRATAPAWQVGCPEVLPLLRAMPVWTHALAETAHWIHTIEVRKEAGGGRGGRRMTEAQKT